MKKSIIILSAMIVSMSFMSSIKGNTYSTSNKLGGVSALCYGYSSNNEHCVNLGGLAAGAGGGAAAYGAAGYIGLVATVSNPVGWVVGGSVLF